MPARFPRLRPCALLLSAATLACGDDTTEPAREVYQITRAQTNTASLPDGNGRVERTRLHHRSPRHADLQPT